VRKILPLLDNYFIPF